MVVKFIYVWFVVFVVQ